MIGKNNFLGKGILAIAGIIGIFAILAIAGNVNASSSVVSDCNAYPDPSWSADHGSAWSSSGAKEGIRNVAVKPDGTADYANLTYTLSPAANWSSYNYCSFWLKITLSANVSFLIVDTDGNFSQWNFTYPPVDKWIRYTVDFSNPDFTNGNLNLSSVCHITFRYWTSNSSLSTFCDVDYIIIHQYNHLVDIPSGNKIKATYDEIQDAIDNASDGDTLVVHDGVYEESLTINKSINLIAGSSPVIKCPSPPEDVYIQESDHYFEYVIAVLGGTYNSTNDTVYGPGTIHVNISGFEINGSNAGTGTSHYFAGIFIRNAIGNISNNYIHDMYGPSGNGSGEQTFGILAYGNSDLTVYGNTIEDFSRGGIVANGDLGSLPDPVANIENNVVIGNGLESATNWWAESGIQMGYEANGTIKENEVYDCMCNNPGWASSGIIVAGTKDVIVEDNDVHDNDDGITMVGYEDYKDAPCHDITIKNNQVYSNLYGISAEANVYHIVIEGNTIHDNDYDGITVWAYNYGWESSTPDNITIQNNEIYNHTYCGIYLTDVFDNISISQNDIYNNGEAVYLDNYFGVDSDASIHYNNIYDNIYYGVWNNGSILVDAEYNYWGDASGPYHSTNPSGQGDNVSDNVDFSPWLGALPGTSPMIWHVNPTGTIQEAIDVASNGDTIKVEPGTYNENLIIDKPLKLVGDPIIDAQGGIGITIEANDTLVENMTVYNFSIGILVHNASFTIHNVTINNCIIYNYSDAGIGIKFDNVVRSFINHTQVNDTNYGIYLRQSDYNNITHNNATSNQYGIYLWGSSNNTIAYNNASDNDRGMDLSSSANYNNITHNNINNSRYYGIYMELSHHNDVTHNTINSTGWNGYSDSVFGIYLTGYASYNNIANNTVTHSGEGLSSSGHGYGIYLKDYPAQPNSGPHNNTIAGNNLSENRDCDMVNMRSPNNTYLNNTVASYPTTFDINDYYGNFTISGVTAPPAMPEGFANISKFLNIASNSPRAWINITIYYDEENVTVNESTLHVWKWNGTVWKFDDWYNYHNVDVLNNSITVNITGLDDPIFAPLQDIAPPTTLKDVGEPQHANGTWVTSHTPIWLNATDNANGSGVNATYYRIWNGIWHPANLSDYYCGNENITNINGTLWYVYRMNGSVVYSPIYFHEECVHYLEYYSVDFAGNEEEINNQTHYVDNTPPEVTKEDGEPKYGYSLYFDGDDRVIVADADNLDITDEITLEAWIKISSYGFYPIIDKMMVSAGYYSGYRMYTSGGKLYFQYGNSTNVLHTYQSTQTIPLNGWVHVVVTFSDGGGNLYINGVPAGTINKMGDIAANTRALGIGYSAMNTKYFNGSIDDVRIYNRALNAYEIRQNYIGNVILDGLVSWWKFNEGAGDIAYDSIDNNNGTIYGATYVEDSPFYLITKDTPIYLNATDYVGVEKLSPGVPIPWQFWDAYDGGVVDIIPNFASQEIVVNISYVTLDYTIPLNDLTWENTSLLPWTSYVVINILPGWRYYIDISPNLGDVAVIVRYTVAWASSPSDILARLINEVEIEPYAGGTPVIVGQLANFDVHNNHSVEVNNFELEFIGNITPGDILEWYDPGGDPYPLPTPNGTIWYGGWGSPPSIMKIEGGIEVIWVDVPHPIPNCEWVHFGLRLDKNITIDDITNIVANWTVSPCSVGSYRIWYRIGNETGWSPWYSGEWNQSVVFTLAELGITENCTHYIQYYAEDDLGNHPPVPDDFCWRDDDPDDNYYLKPGFYGPDKTPNTADDPYNIDQHFGPDGIPGSGDEWQWGGAGAGNYWCVPSASASCLWWFADWYNLPGLKGKGTIYQLADLLGKKYMGTAVPPGGTSRNNWTAGLRRYFNDTGYGNMISVSYYAEGTFNYSFLYNELSRCQDVMLGIVNDPPNWHAVVLTSANATGVNNSTWNVDIMDPWTGSCVNTTIVQSPGGLVIWYDSNYWEFFMVTVCPSYEADLQTVYVDNMPPTTTVSFEGPSFLSEEGIWYVTSHTNISLLTQDLGDCAIGCEYLHWETYIWNESIENWVAVNVSVWNGTAWENRSEGDEYNNSLLFRFNEECRHLIKYYGVDKFGNVETENEMEIRVDDTPPTAQVSVGTPYYGQHVTTRTTLQLVATDGGKCPVGSYKIYYNIWYNGSWYWDEPLVSENESTPLFNFTEECEHSIWYRVVDDLGNEREGNETFYVDDSPPLSTISPANGSYVNTSDTITITAVDLQGTCAAGVGMIYYRIWNGTWSDWIGRGTSIEFNFNENCTHYVEFYARDRLGNEEEVQNATYYVDVTPPSTVMEVGKPKYGNYITSHTPIWLNATDAGCNGGAGVAELHYIITYGSSVEYVVYDNDGNDKNTTVGVISVEITLDGECNHSITYWAVDNAGNVEEHHSAYFLVDNSPPIINLTIGEPKYEKDGMLFINFSTPIYINATDNGTEPCIVGSVNLSVRVYRILEEPIWVDLQWNNVSSGWAHISLNIYEECMHWINITAIDDLGNTAYYNKTVYVDDSPPIIVKEIGKPRYGITGKRVDQEQTGDGFYNSSNPLNSSSQPPLWNAQSFIPNYHRLDAVQLLLCLTSGSEEEGANVNVTILDSDLNVVGQSSTVYVTTQPHRAEWFQFHFDPSLYLTPGRTYYITANADVDNTIWWVFDSWTDYHRGAMWNGGVEDPRYDRAFKTEYYTYSHINFSTPIWINITDDGLCKVGSLHVRVGIWYNETWNYTWYNISDGSINLTLHFNEECIHALNITAYDDLGNIAYDNETFHVDNSPPYSDVDDIIPYCQHVNETNLLTINVTAYDLPDCGVGIANITLYYRYARYNHSFTPWISLGTLNSPPWQWQFSAPNGSGYYQFYTVAYDLFGHCKSTPSVEARLCVIYNHTFTLYPGWNMITLPVKNKNILTAEDFGDYLNTFGDVCTVITKWDASKQQYISHVVGFGEGFDITPGEGYFVFTVIEEEQEFYVEGCLIEYDEISLPLYVGYNLIGWANIENTNTSELLQNIPNCTKIGRWDASSQYWPPEYTIKAPPVASFDIFMGDAVFAYRNVQTVIIWDGGRSMLTLPP